MKRVLLVIAVLLGALGRPVAAQTDARQLPPEQRAARESPGQVSAADLVSLENIRAGLRGERSWRSSYSTFVPASAVRATGLPVYRAEIIGYRPASYEDSLRAAAADRWAPARPGYLDWAPGVMRAATPLVGGAVSVDPAFIVHAFQRWSYRRAVAKAKREVEEELEALQKAQAAGKKR